MTMDGFDDVPLRWEILGGFGIGLDETGRWQSVSAGLMRDALCLYYIWACLSSRHTVGNAHVYVIHTMGYKDCFSMDKWGFGQTGKSWIESLKPGLEGPTTFYLPLSPLFSLSPERIFLTSPERITVFHLWHRAPPFLVIVISMEKEDEGVVIWCICIGWEELALFFFCVFDGMRWDSDQYWSIIQRWLYSTLICDIYDPVVLWCSLFEDILMAYFSLVGEVIISVKL